MRILVVGGTGFLGGAVARHAVAEGHQVTVMSRSGAGVAPGASTLIADRDTALADLGGRFDGVIDTCAYAPDMVDRLSQAVGEVSTYVMVSSISAYAALPEHGMDETAPIAKATAADLATAASVGPADRCNATAYGAAYGPLKATCEQRAGRWCQDAALIRLGLIVGPEDYTDRFTWWCRRIDQGGVIPVPLPEDRRVQIIDVRDAAAFLVHLAKTGTGGTFNVTGRPMRLYQMLTSIADISPAATVLQPLPYSAFAAAEVAPWTDLPLVLGDWPDLAGMLSVSTDRAVAEGLQTRPLAETIADTLNWDRQQRDTPLAVGMTAAQEQAVKDAI